MSIRPRKAVIGGLKYDTEKSKYIASDAAENPLPEDHVQARVRHLYRTPDGRFFFGVQSVVPGDKAEKIIGCTDEDAREFVEKHSDVTTYEALFGSVPDA